MKQNLKMKNSKINSVQKKNVKPVLSVIRRQNLQISPNFMNSSVENSELDVENKKGNEYVSNNSNQLYLNKESYRSLFHKKKIFNIDHDKIKPREVRDINLLN